ncbi:LysR substrate-binding domain-containing protein [Microvirga massiliensis]|uniref:LysR substrate-binding domain-containing protein n=1 Tax=Microvirga massiliensis TaxID=1033741 RepID=UPI0009E36A2E|nr:LysR substrate-binding domain-containing protein [Microvirga massiliensis]
MCSGVTAATVPTDVTAARDARLALRLPPLASLRLFEAAARLGSFRKAADELNVTPSAVSHGIETLEKWIGAPLFIRDGRRIIPTETAEDFLPYVAEGLSLIAVGARRVSPLEDDRRLSLSVPPTFAAEWLMPRLHGFRARYPDIKLIFDSSHRQVVFPLEGIDIAIRMGRAQWPGTTAHLLFRETLLPVASPAYRASLASADGLRWEEATLIHVRTVSRDWDEWLTHTGLAVTPRGHLSVDTIHLAIAAAAGSLGIALARLPLCDGLLDARRVVDIGHAPLAIETGYWVTVPSGREPRRDVRAFLNWIVAEAEADASG